MRKTKRHHQPANSRWRIHFHLASFWFWWVAFFIVSLTFLLLALKFSGVSPDEKKKWLSPPQMRFAYCYAVVDEIRKYKTNQLPRHIDTALEYLDKTSKSLIPRPAFPIDIYPDQYRQRQIQLSQAQATGLNDNVIGPPKWYRLRPETELILKALGEFTMKLRDRLKDRKDLPTIETALTYLASYQYFEIPELSDSKSEGRFEEGIQSLVNFAQQVTSQAPYRSEQLKVTPKEKLSLKLVALVSRVTALHKHENALVAFFFWLVFLLLLFSGVFAVALRYSAIKMDSTILTMVIGGSILGAITAVTIPRVGRQKKDRD
jgi:hypothetical protein